MFRLHALWCAGLSDLFRTMDLGSMLQQFSCGGRMLQYFDHAVVYLNCT